MHNHIKIALLLLLASCLFMITGVMQNKLFSQTMARGNYFFQKTKENSYVKSIVIKFPDKTKITFRQQDGLWRIKEADDYYADFSKINSLLKIIHNTTIYRSDKIKENTDLSELTADALSIRSFDTDDKIIDDALIIPKQDVNRFYYAILDQQPVLYQLNGQLELSPLLMDWVQSPLLAISYKQIKNIKADNFQVYRRIPNGTIFNAETDEEVSNVQGFAQHFWYLSADEIRHALHFDRSQYPNTKSFVFTTFDGAIYQLTVFYNQQDYWLSIKLNHERIVSPSVIKFVKENAMLFDGWYFKINSNVGSAITNFIL